MWQRQYWWGEKHTRYNYNKGRCGSLKKRQCHVHGSQGTKMGDIDAVIKWNFMNKWEIKGRHIECTFFF